MKRLIALALVSALMIGVAGSAFAQNHHERRTKMVNENVDHVLCIWLKPWPFNDCWQAPAPPPPPAPAATPADSDGDGVNDADDACPDTPRGVKVDRKGCPKDGDGDGVFDGLDKCPDTPNGARVGRDGCPTDSDGDGVFDGIDRCPNTPRGAKVDNKGCPTERSEREMEFLDTGVIRTSAIRFESGKSDIKSMSHKTMDEIGMILVQWPTLEIEIAGHTDSQGSEELNRKLSRQRAQAVHDYIVKKYPKIKKENLTVKGYGEKSPIASNDTAEGRAQNRRVEFTVLNKEQLKRAIEKRR